MERTVELVCLDDNIVRIGQDVVGAVVLRNASKEGITVQMALMHDMGTHGRRGRFAVRSCHTQALMLTGQRSQNLSALLYLKAILTEIFQFLMVGWDSWRIDHQTKNALALVNKDAALYVKDMEAPALLIPLAIDTVQDDVKLKSLSENILKMALPASAEIIAKEVVTLASQKR